MNAINHWHGYFLHYPPDMGVTYPVWGDPRIPPWVQFHVPGDQPGEFADILMDWMAVVPAPLCRFLLTTGPVPRPAALRSTKPATTGAAETVCLTFSGTEEDTATWRERITELLPLCSFLHLDRLCDPDLQRFNDSVRVAAVPGDEHPCTTTACPLPTPPRARDRR